MIRVCMTPMARGEDHGFGGVFRVAKAMQDGLGAHGIEVVEQPEDADVLAAHISIPPAWVSRFGDKPMVLHCHGLYWAEYEWPRGMLVNNAEILESMRHVDAITVPSYWVRDIITRHTLRRPYVVPHGVTMEDFPPGDAKGYVWWDKNRTDPICDPSVVNAVARLVPDTQFVTTYGEQAPNVTVIGKQPYEKASELTRHASIYLATSRETFGVATLQAMAAGVPVAGYAWGAQPEIVPGDMLAPFGDVEELARIIRRIQADWPSYSRRVREIAEAYPWDHAMERYAEVYRSALTRRQPTSPRTSIIVPAYNLAEFLPDTLRSVQAQTDPDWECIVVDDGSTDATGEIADEFAAADERFRVIHNGTNRYLPYSRNIAVAHARGRYILPVDADDQLTPEAVQILADALDSDRTVHIVYGNVYFTEPDGRTPMRYRDDLEPGYSGWPFWFRLDWQIAGRNLLPYSSMYRREVWENTGGYRPRCKTAEDADYWTRAASYGYRPKRVTEAPTLIYRNRHNSMSRMAGQRDWSKWFPWRHIPHLLPAGAVTEANEAHIPSYDPPAISVVIPVGPGHERLVMDALDSIEAQTFGWWEAIVINDAGAPFEFPLPAWARVISTGGNEGTAHARNIGIQQARADWILPLDADDLLEPDALLTFWEAHRERPECILYSDFWEDPQERDQWQVWRAPDFSGDRLVGGGAVAAVTMLYPRAAALEVGGYDTDLPWEDWLFHLKLCEAGWCSARIAKPLFSYRKHTGRRRTENAATRPDNKAAIMGRYSRYWEGRAMGCGCKGNSQRTITATASTSPMGATRTMTAVSNPEEQDMALIRYTGPRAGTFQMRGPSGQRYSWSAGVEQYVFGQDAEMHLNRPDFEAVAEDGAAESPSLVSENPEAATGSDLAPADDAPESAPATAEAEPQAEAPKPKRGRPRKTEAAE